MTLNLKPKQHQQSLVGEIVSHNTLVPGGKNQLAKRAPQQIHIPNHSGKFGLLSFYLDVGRQLHPLCRGAFIERVELGYYHYERRWRISTCAMAAAYAGAFGFQAVEQVGLSYSEAVWRLSHLLGYDLNSEVAGPTGRVQPLAQEMIVLIDHEYWTRSGVADWLAGEGL